MNQSETANEGNGLPEPYKKSVLNARLLLKDELVCHDRQALLGQFMIECRRMTMAESCAIFIKPSPTAGHLILEATLTDKFGHNFQRGVSVTISAQHGAGLSGYIATLSEPFRKHGQELRSLPWIAGIKPDHLTTGYCHSVLAAPFVGPGGQMMGYIKCENKMDPSGGVAENGGFTETDETALVEIAKTVGKALEKLHEFECFHRSGGGKDNNPGTGEFLWSLLSTASVVLGIDRGVIFLADFATSTLRGAALFGCEDLPIKASEFIFGMADTSIATHVFGGAEPYFTPDITGDPVASPWGVERFEITGPVIGVPLRRGERVLGSIVVWSAKGTPPSKEAIPLLATLGHIGGTGLARLLEERNAILAQHLLIEGLAAGLIRKDLSFRFVYCNKFVLSLLGRPFEEVLLKTDYELYPKALADKFRRDDVDVIKNARVLTDVELNRDAEGNSICVHVMKQPLRDPFGTIIGLQCVFLRLPMGSWEKVREEEKMTQLGSWEWDLESDQMSGSDQLWRLFETSRTHHASLEDTFLKRVHAEDYDHVKERIDAVKLDPKPFEIDFRIVRADRSQRFLKAHATVAEDEAGIPVRMYGTFQDITAAKLEEARAIQAEKFRVVGQLAGQVAHDTLTQFATIQTALGRLERHITDPNLTVSIQDAKTAYSEAHATLTELKKLGAEPAGKPERLDMDDIISGLLRLCRPDLMKKQIEVSYVPSGVLPKVFVDPHKAKQAIMNIITNAQEAMPAGGDLIIRAREETADRLIRRKGSQRGFPKICDSVVVLEIQDRGCGIPGDILNDIFKPGFTTKGERGGTGHGLTSCKTNMELHGGEVNARNNDDGPGATFELVFPAITGPL